MQIDNSVPLGTEIRIRGRVYRIDLTGNQVIKLTRRFTFKTRLYPRSAPISWIDRKFKLSFIRACWNFVDDLLGEGACERYFGIRACSVEQILGLLGYLADEIEKQRTEQGGNTYGKN
ncbi:hypothetical protein Ami103574_00075 [Aminipila butyrica]|uniref:Uncharacterized protein n=1 Tax=Aminipila butyrica TaxID=433296 RepID=A0A858BS73_9FIRM|nr:hypothetical protein [Aminipila butyrica]QIB67810.1 hypothetical protein Ami103574_00075 [Aminipila butyrica]